MDGGLETAAETGSLVLLVEELKACKDGKKNKAREEGHRRRNQLPVEWGDWARSLAMKDSGLWPHIDCRHVERKRWSQHSLLTSQALAEASGVPGGAAPQHSAAEVLLCWGHLSGGRDNKEIVIQVASLLALEVWLSG